MADQSYDFAEPDPPKPAPPPRRPPPQDQPAARPAAAGAAAPAAPAEAAKPPLESTCPSCGFTLHGPPKAHCPECAAPMDRSVADQIKFADPAWVRGVAMGLMLLTPPIAGHAAAAFLRFMSPPLAAWMHVISATVFLAAVLLAARPQPLAKSNAGNSLLLVKGGAALALVLWLLLALRVPHPEIPPGLNVAPLRSLDKILVCLALATQGGLALLLGFFCGRIATNIPDDSLAAHSINGGWLAGIACWSLMVLQLVELTTRYHIMFYFCSFPMIGGLALIFLFAIVTLLRLALEMRTSADEGEAIRVRRAQRAAGIKPPPKNPPKTTTL